MKPTPNNDLRIRPEVVEHLGYCVYAYIDPRNDEIFCVGEGCVSRVLAHLDDEIRLAETQRINA